MSILAILCSDIHLSHSCPSARTAEDCWYEAMARPLQEIRNLAARHRAPVVIAGDIFHRWNEPAELINFALDHLPEAYAVPGQHDLPYHRMDLIKRSAFWTLVKVGKLKLIDLPVVLQDRLILHGFGWGKPIVPMSSERGDWLHLAVCHAYVWKEGYGYPGAPDSARLAKYWKNLQGYDAAVFGDNHKGFLFQNRAPAHPDGATIRSVLNSGTLMRRRTDEIAYQPHIGLLHDNGDIELHYLDTTKDQFITAALVDERKVVDAEEFLEGLKSLETDSLNFHDAVLHAMDELSVSDDVREIVVGLIGGE